MVKRLLAFLMLLWLPVTALAQNPVVVDDANLFSTQEEAEIQKKAMEIIKRSQVDVVVVTS